MRLGILGGTFDPVHYGHLLLAERCREAVRLDEVWFLPAAVPPHKQQLAMSTPEARVEMLELAIAGNEAFRVCTLEVARGGVNYTFETLAALQAERPGDELFFLMGADSLRDLPTWREPQRLCALATPVVVSRASTTDPERAEPVDWQGLAAVIAADRLAAIRQHLVAMPRVDLSSRELRRRVAAGQSIRYCMPRSVEKYIEANGLYRA